MTIKSKRRDGFKGEKQIIIPEKVWKETIARDPTPFKLHISHLGYFPKAYGHYRDRRKGCEDNILFYCMQGKGHLLLDGKKFTVVANQFMIVPATEKSIRYWADDEDPWTIYWIHYTGSDIDALNHSLNIKLFDGPVNIPHNEKAIEIWENIYQNLEMGYSRENLVNATFCLYYLLITFIYPKKHLVKDKNEPDDIITKTIKHMRANIINKLSIDDMAAIHQLSTSHFSGLFKKSTGMSPNDYFIHLKMQRACNLLNADNVKIRQVATDLGYDDPYYFSRLFKKFMNVSPEQYKLSAQRHL